MKFLCVPCDTPMRLNATAESEPGSLSVVYACPECGYEMAMLTNAQETQMVRSLGVRIGPSAAAAIASPGGGAVAAEGAPSGAKCPFSAMLSAGDGIRSIGYRGVHERGFVDAGGARSPRIDPGDGPADGQGGNRDGRQGERPGGDRRGDPHRGAHPFRDVIPADRRRATITTR